MNVLNYFLNHLTKGFLALTIFMVVATGLVSYWAGTTFPVLMTWLFVVGTGFTYTTMYWVFKHGNTTVGYKAAHYLSHLLSTLPWPVNVLNHFAMFIGYACAGLWLVVGMGVVYILVLSWFRQRAIIEWEKLHGMSA